MRICLFVILNLSLLACQVNSLSETEEKQWKLTTVASPTSSHSGEPHLFVSPQAKVYLSWIDALENEEHALRFAQWENDQWSEAQTIAQDSGWFVNWADFPSLVVDNNFMAAHWLAKSAEGTYDYDVQVAISEDQGNSWSSPFVLHRDGIPAEHGFVSMLPYAQNQVFAVWLDGRFTKNDAHAGHGAEGEGSGGAMTLHATTFDQSGNMGEETMLDTRICDCCQTDAATTDQGVVVVYRDRSDEEVRDIYILREQDGKWTDPQPVHADQWQIKGCPVNGPAVAAAGKKVAVAWFTASEDTPKVQLAFSHDYGASFGEPVRIDHGNALGRVDVVMLEEDQVMVSWMEGNEQGAEIRAALLDANQQILADKRIVNTASSRSSGFPIMERMGKQIFFAWTQVTEARSEVMTAIVDTNDLIP